MSPPAVTPENRQRALRSDSIRNRRKLIEAGVELAGERGSDISFHELAERAGVGVGTAYRHFADQAALIEALYDHAVMELAGSLLIEVEGASAWDQLVVRLERMTIAVAETPGLGALMKRMYELDPDHAPAGALTGAVAEVLQQAKTEGSLRDDATSGDIVLLPLMIGGFVGHPDEAERAMLLRHLTIALNGLRADPLTATPLPEVHLSEPEFHRFVHRNTSRQRR